MQPEPVADPHWKKGDGRREAHYMQKTAPRDLAPREGEILMGSLFSEPMRVETVRSTGPQTWVLGLVGVSSERFRSVTLTASELATLKVSTQGFTYAGDAHLLRLGLQAYASTCP